MTPTGKQFLSDLPGRYRIRVQGRLSSRMSSRLSDMDIRVWRQTSELPVTTLTGELRDQAALLGVLNTLFDLGCPLLKVERLAVLPGKRPTDRDTETL